MKPGLLNFLAAVAVATTVQAISGPALAETPEETVAYAFLGLAGGAELNRGPMHLTWRAASASPAMFVGHGEGAGVSYDVTFTVTALSDCEYEIQLAGPPGMVPGGKALYARIALDRITGVEAGAFHVTVEGDGYCQTGERNPTCTVVHRVDLFGAVEPVRHARLVDALHRDVCVKPD
jgi:hypothetical protein